MDINVFTKYKVKYTCKYSYINEDGDFRDDEAAWEHVLDGWSLIEHIIRLMNDVDFMRILATDKMIYIEHFNPNTGEPADYTYEFEETDEDE